ncbi:MAG: DegV family protein [Anaerolineales bacterium]|nr:DegV family protein [Anaerolineales bacterium]
MTRVAIVTDSVASIPQTLIDELNIHLVPYYIHRGTETLRDLVTAKAESFYQWMETATELPKTANPSPGEYLEKYLQLAEEGAREIISIHITSKGSGAYAAAMAAKKMFHEKFPKVRLEVIDSLNVQMCQGWMVIEAARAALKGFSLKEIKEKVQKMIPVSHMYQTADTLRFLYLGGRIGRAKHLVASMLDIKPIISMVDGEIVALGQTRTRKKVYKAMVDKLEEFAGQRGIKIAFVHAAARQEAEKLKAMVEERVEVVESLICELSPALGVHSGPGTVGFCFYPVTEE